MKKTWKDRVWQWICPRRCPVCFQIVDPKEQALEGLCCRGCYPRIRFVESPTCFSCGREVASVTREFCEECRRNRRNHVRGVALMDYSDGVASKMLWKLKYENGREYADFLAMEMEKRYGKLIRSWQVDCVVPVPVHKTRLRERGYNQAEVLARCLAQRLDLKTESKGLLRVGRTMAQKELNRQERFNNLKDAFCATSRMGQYKRVLLVDDIFTTGSTAYICTRALRDVGIEEVYLANFSIGRTEETEME